MPRRAGRLAESSPCRHERPTTPSERGSDAGDALLGEEPTLPLEATRDSPFSVLLLARTGTLRIPRAQAAAAARLRSGLRGARVKNIVRELNNEKVDIIRWSDDIHAFVSEALKPAEIKSITLDEENNSVLVRVDEEELSKAIGRRGQNARLTARLVGWDVQVQKDESAHEAFEAQVSQAASAISDAADIEEETAIALVRGGLMSLEMIANDVDEVDIADVLGVSVEEGKSILDKAKAAVGGGDDASEEAGEESAEADESSDSPEAAAEEEAPEAAAEAEEPAEEEQAKEEETAEG